MNFKANTKQVYKWHKLSHKQPLLNTEVIFYSFEHDQRRIGILRMEDTESTWVSTDSKTAWVAQADDYWTNLPPLPEV